MGRHRSTFRACKMIANMKRPILFAFVAGITVLAPAAAQQVPQTPPARRLTLAMALDIAERQNLELAAARLQRSVALAGIRIARRIPNPAVGGSVARDTPHEDLTVGIPIENWRPARASLPALIVSSCVVSSACTLKRLYRGEVA